MLWRSGSSGIEVRLRHPGTGWGEGHALMILENPSSIYRGLQAHVWRANCTHAEMTRTAEVLIQETLTAEMGCSRRRNRDCRGRAVETQDK